MIFLSDFSDSSALVSSLSTVEDLVSVVVFAGVDAVGFGGGRVGAGKPGTTGTALGGCGAVVLVEGVVLAGAEGVDFGVVWGGLEGMVVGGVGGLVLMGLIGTGKGGTLDGEFLV
jgi:hypothetical protein